MRLVYVALTVTCDPLGIVAGDTTSDYGFLSAGATSDGAASAHVAATATSAAKEILRAFIRVLPSAGHETVSGLRAGFMRPQAHRLPRRA